MGLFDKLPFGKKKHDLGDDFSAPPDFSQPPGLNDPAQGDALYGKDPLQNPNPYGQQPDPFGQQPDPFAQQKPPGTFDNDIFTTGGNADGARQFAQGLGGSSAGVGQQPPTTQAGGAVTGHEANLILERLDTIKAEIDAVKQRMMRIERFMESAEQKAGQKRYF